MENKKQELIDLLDEISNPDVIIISSTLKSMASELLKSINSPEPVERRAIGENKQAEEYCPNCGVNDDHISILGNARYCHHCEHNWTI